MKQKQKGKSILVIGMGRFGKHLAVKLFELGNDVMVVDKDDKIIQSVSSIIEDVIVGDCTDENVVRSLGIGNFDMCFVTIGRNFESSLVVTSLLKKFGAKYIVTKAGRDIQTDILKKIGADEVVYPERELAEKLAVKYNASSILDYIELTSEHAIYEIYVPEDWVGKTIGEINVRRRYRINILAVKNEASVQPMPSADYEFNDGDQIVISGKPTDIKRLTPQG